jgi:tRNA A37 methylthiotransferase MiaB
MPLQSGSDRILAAMHRWYRTEHYARRVELIHERLPHAAIGADVITGFPGETDEDHAATVTFIEHLPFTYLHVFSYSARPGTKAASLPDQIPGHIIKRRARQLRALSEKKSSAFRHSQIGQTLRVLTLRGEDSTDHQPEHLSNHSENFRPMLSAQKSGAKPTLSAPSNSFTPALSANYTRVRVAGIFPANQWHNVFISSQEGNYLVGEPLSDNLLCDSSVLSASLR